MLPQGALLQCAHIPAVQKHPALRHVVEAGDELAQGGLPAAGGAHHRHRLPGGDVQGQVLQHRLVGGVVPEGHVLQPDVSGHLRQVPGPGGILDLGLQAHELHKALETGHSLHELLHKGGELPNGGNKGGDIEGEGGQIDKVHLPPHDERPAEGDDQHREHPHEKLHPRLIEGHRPVITPLGPPELVVGGVELIPLGGLVGKGLGGAHAGERGLHLPVDAG